MKKPESKKLTLDGHHGHLEAQLSIPENVSGPVAVVCHPHPLYGGSMDNKVVHYAARALLEIGAIVLRFNFRGVGDSAGSFDDAVGEIDDCLVAVDWLQQQYPEHSLILAGFSFGAYIATQAAVQVSPAALITIAPAVNHYQISVSERVSYPWLLIQGDDDEVVPADDVRQWLAQTDQVSDVRWLAGAGHFFHGRLVELRAIISRWLRENLPP